MNIGSVFYFVFYKDLHPAMFRGYSWLCTQTSTPGGACAWDHMGCLELNTGPLFARQGPSPLAISLVPCVLLFLGNVLVILHLGHQ